MSGWALAIFIPVMIIVPFGGLAFGLSIEKWPWLLDCCAIGWAMAVASVFLAAEWLAPIAGAGLVVIYYLNWLAYRTARAYDEIRKGKR